VILAYAIIALIVIALILRRDLSTIGKISFRGGWKLVAIVLGLYVLQAVMVVYVQGQSNAQMLILNISQMALLFLVLLNYHLPGAKIFILGLALNIMVMVVNGGWMPVTLETYYFVHPDRTIEIGSKPSSSKNIILPREETNLWVLSDIIRVTLPWRPWALSVGDVLLVVGVAQFIFQTTLTKEALIKPKRGSDSIGHIYE
jgi:hypothetical protein